MLVKKRPEKYSKIKFEIGYLKDFEKLKPIRKRDAYYPSNMRGYPDLEQKIQRYVHRQYRDKAVLAQSTPENSPWQVLFESLDQFSDDFMVIRDQPPLDIREAF